MTSCPRPEFVSCQNDSDCARLVRGATDPTEATCQGGYCEHACMEQYRQGALPALGGDLLSPWCGATNNGVPWGSVCVKDSAWRRGEIPVQCALPYEGYVCPPGWEKALWNDGEASKMIDCNGAVRHCYGDDTPCCQNGSPLCGGCGSDWPVWRP